MKFFTTDDFAENEWVAIPAGQAANIANAKLEREGKVVYGLVFPSEFLWAENNEPSDTHRALLVCIEEIEKPKCEHACEGSNVSNNRYFCYKCGKELKPTGWEVVE